MLYPKVYPKAIQATLSKNFKNMQVAFYLKRPESKTPTAIFARISYRSNKLKFYTEESILPKFWNKETLQAKETQKFREYPELNARLNEIEATIKSTFLRYQTVSLYLQ